MGLCVSASILSEDAICIEHVAAQGESLWVPGSAEVMGTQTTSKKAPPEHVTMILLFLHYSGRRCKLCKTQIYVQTWVETFMM